MFLAKNNIIVEIKSSTKPEYAILNPVSGSFDLMDRSEYNMLQKINDGLIPDTEFASYLLERGYAFNSKSEHDASVNKAYAEFKKEIEASQVQLMLIPTYGCNLACIYCYQGKGTTGAKAAPSNSFSLISKETVDAFFNYAKGNFSHSPLKPFITLFGGEPLINSRAQREIIEYIVSRCAEEGYELSVVTNGYDLVDYIELLKKVKIKEIQITLDGSPSVHDSRRAASNKKSSFHRIIEGMEKAIAAGMPINLRSVVDSENLEDMVTLARFLDGKGWLDLPPELFKTQIGRNYELFDCYAKPQHLMTQTQLWAEFAALSKNNPVLSKFHRPDFKGVRHLVDTGDMYIASFDTCPACKTEWVFDLHGRIYGCTASCGREEYLLGTFWPEVRLKDSAISAWKKRDVMSIEKCRTCKFDVICGGGCGVVAANKNRGDILSPDCRPIQELLDIGVNHYIDEIKAIAEEGCLICGKELVYSDTACSKEPCKICGRQFDTYVKCRDGHFICDTCHSSDTPGKVLQLLSAGSEQNPVRLAESVFELPGLNMHGPEYHSIVPAVLVSAYQNLLGVRDESKINEAIKRGKEVKGGNCGFFGCCGASVGAGIAVSILEGVTPMSRTDRGSASRATGQALLDISRYGGPRCCKREAITSIMAFMDVTEYFDELPESKYVCKQFNKNKDCIYSKCPYFPANKNKKG